MEKTKELFHLNVRRLVDKDGRDLQAIADSCGISMSMLSQLKAGSTGYSAKTVENLCNGLKCNPAELFYSPDDLFESKSDLILSIQARLTTLNHDELSLIVTIIDDLVVGRPLNLKTTVAK